MPEKNEHHDFCLRWNTLQPRKNNECPLGLYQEWDRPPSSWCPLDGLIRSDGMRWHDFHAVKLVLGKGCYSEVERPPQTDGRLTWPQIDGCVVWVQKALDKLGPSFDEFSLRLKDVPLEEIRFCWKAHLVADFACPYCWEATNQGKKYSKYNEIKRKDPSLWDAICDYVTNVYHCIR